MEELARLKKEIEDNKRKIKEIEKKQKETAVKISKRELDSFKSFIQNTQSHKHYHLLRFIEELDVGNGTLDNILMWFPTIKDIEQARQFICHIRPNYNNTFLKAIEYIKENENEDEDDV